MKIFVTFIFVCMSVTFGLPIDDYRITFPDNHKIRKIIGRFGDFKTDQKRILDDPNLLKSENITKELFIDEEADTKLENGNYYQGDIILHQDQVEIINRIEIRADNNNDENDSLGARTGIIWAAYRWPKDSKGTVTVPYLIDKNHFDTFDELKILLGMLDIEKYTCIQFLPRKTEKNYIHIYSGIGCSSYLGMQGGRQLISLKRKGCMSRGTIIHELIHALGYDHMQNHYDRDNYVYILWDNIYEPHKHNFLKVNPILFSNFGTQYDFYSVMHYEPYAFTRNGRPTVLPKDTSFNKIIGQRNALSSGDAERINNMYRCYS